MSLATRRDAPLYSLYEAARYLNVPHGTVVNWTRATKDGNLVIPADRKRNTLSFDNLVELHIVDGLRKQKQISTRTIRRAVSNAAKRHKIDRLLLHPDVLTCGGEIILERVNDLESLGQLGQLVAKDIVVRLLERIRVDKNGQPSALFPVFSQQYQKRLVSLDPAQAFGRPIIDRIGLRTDYVADKISAGESRSIVMNEFDITDSELLYACAYESLRAAA